MKDESGFLPLCFFSVYQKALLTSSQVRTLEKSAAVTPSGNPANGTGLRHPFGKIIRDGRLNTPSI
jgi:hypothetical protein